MQQNYDKIKAEGAELIAISSDNQAATKKSVDNRKLKFPVLSDSERETIEAYNVIDPNNKRIARPSGFVIKLDGTVAWKTLGTKNHRVPTNQILTELGKL